MAKKLTYTDILQQYHPGDKEFHQAVHEVFEDIMPAYKKESSYKSSAVLEQLLEPDRILRFRVSWQDDDGAIQVNRGWRVQYNNALGAYKGGLRLHPTVNESILKFLGFEQCFKNALTGLPMGGAKGGSDFDPKDKSDAEILRFCQSFMSELYRHIGPQVDVPAGDINVGAREIGYMQGHYLKLTNRWEGALTGKGETWGGSAGRTEATGYGLIYFLKNMLDAHDGKLSEKKILISGAGNVALHAAEKCLAEDATVLTLSDSGGTLYFKNGLDETTLKKIKKIKLEEHGSLKDLKEGSFRKGKNPWDIVDADIALPCATQNEIEKDSAKKLVARGITYLAEGANMPLTADAQDVIMKKGIIYGPGKASNAGGVAVSGLERTQNASLKPWTFEQVDSELQSIMSAIHDRSVENIRRSDGIYHYRKGANIYGFKKLANALVAYGMK